MHSARLLRTEEHAVPEIAARHFECSYRICVVLNSDRCSRLAILAFKANLQGIIMTLGIASISV